MYEPRPSHDYARPPITEAVIEILVAGEISEKAQERIAERLKKRYPDAQPLHEVAFQMDATGGNVAVHQFAKGRRLTSRDQADIVLLKPQGLVNARLPPYPGWNAFRECAAENWETWRSTAPAFDIQRLGIRYINRLDIPSPDNMLNLDDYVVFHPRTGAALGQSPLSAFLVQFTLPSFKPLWFATITSTMVTPPPLPKHTSLMLDIDVFRTEQIPVKSDDLWSTIDEAREIKNDLFERALTEKTKELFRK